MFLTWRPRREASYSGCYILNEDQLARQAFRRDQGLPPTTGLAHFRRVWNTLRSTESSCLATSAVHSWRIGVLPMCTEPVLAFHAQRSRTASPISDLAICDWHSQGRTCIH